MRSANAIKVHRKSGEAERRDLRFRGLFVEMFFDRAYPDFLPRATGQDAYAPFSKERRMMFANANHFYRKSGVA
jgi:hypothetical protein